MTRVNLIHVEDLADQHLFAEMREIKMIPPAFLRSLRSRGAINLKNAIPKEFALNKGHVFFFYDKMKFLQNRYRLLLQECLSRGYNLDPSQMKMDGIFETGDMWFNDWEPTKKDIKISVDRIILRISDKPNWYKMRGISLSRGWENLYSRYD